ncbi:unnamed protein product, partial [Discosporangium mesarthrocarpum]
GGKDILRRAGLWAGVGIGAVFQGAPVQDVGQYASLAEENLRRHCLLTPERNWKEGDRQETEGAPIVLHGESSLGGAGSGAGAGAGAAEVRDKGSAGEGCEDAEIVELVRVQLMLSLLQGMLGKDEASDNHLERARQHMASCPPHITEVLTLLTEIKEDRCPLPPLAPENAAALPGPTAPATATAAGV